MELRTWIGIGAGAFVALGLGLGFADFGTPHHNRMLEEDASTARTISSIASDIFDDHGNRVPPQRLTYPSRAAMELKPGISYRRLSGETYALCATFHETNDGTEVNPFDATLWSHPAGKYCYHFDRTSRLPMLASPRAAMNTDRFAPSSRESRLHRLSSEASASAARMSRPTSVPSSRC